MNDLYIISSVVYLTCINSSITVSVAQYDVIDTVNLLFHHVVFLV